MNRPEGAKARRFGWFPSLVRLGETRDTLHVVDGESSGGVLRMGGFQGDAVMVWWDSLYLGPVPDALSLEELSEVRAREFCKKHPRARVEEARTMLAERNGLLQRFREFRELVLWFGGGLHQLALVQVLAWLAEQDRGSTRISLTTADLAIHPPEVARPAYQARTPVTEAQFRLATETWKRYRSPEPTRLEALARDDLSALPQLGAAIGFQLKEYPSLASGLSRLERNVLEKAISTDGRIARVVAAVLVDEDESRCGDQPLFEMMFRFLTGAHPLVRLSEASHGPVRWPEARGKSVAVTETGLRVLRGEADQVALNGIDRWIGGVHLAGDRVPWRWNEDAGCLVPGADAS